MLRSIFGTLIVLSHLTIPCLGCDYKILDQEAETIGNRIFCNEEVKGPMILRTLNFLYDENQVDQKYRESGEFAKLLAAKKTEIADPAFLSFAELCLHTYDVEQSSKNKAALHMLFERTSKKFQTWYKLRKKGMPEEIPTSPATLRQMVDAADQFFAMDKSGSLAFFNKTPPIDTH